MNSKLYNKRYKIPDNIIIYIRKFLILYPNSIGIKRAKFIVNNGYITYQELKRLKNFFDNYNTQEKGNIQYNLAGGDLMRNFVEKTLTSERNAIKRDNAVKQDIHANPNSELKPYKSIRLDNINEEFNDNNIKKNAVAVIVNKYNQILLLKRSNNPNQWMSNKWSLVGGGIEDNETPEEAIKREIKEETNLNIFDFVNPLVIQWFNDSIEYLFACRYWGNSNDVILNDENVNFGWFDLNEIYFLNTVPHLMEYIILTFKKYE